MKSTDKQGGRGGGHCIGDCTPTRDRGQSEVKRSRRNSEAGHLTSGQARNRGQLKNGQSLSRRSMGVWLMLDSQGSRPDFWCSQGVKHENLLGPLGIVKICC